MTTQYSAASGTAAGAELAAAEQLYSFPVSAQQRGLWFVQQLDLASSVYNTPLVLRLRGRLDHAALKEAFREIQRRHEVLRTTFSLVNDEPMQIVHPPRPVLLPVIDISGLDGKTRAKAALHLRKQNCERAIDLEKGPLLRLSVLRMEEELHELHLVTHHIANDGWSEGVLLYELTVLYEAYSRGRHSPLPELPIQYADYALWQQELLRGDFLASQLEYWRNKLADLPALEIPCDHLPEQEKWRPGETLPFRLPVELSRQVRNLARREGVTLFVVLLAALKLVLSRYSRQKDIAVATIIANRTQGETEGLIGCFVNTLVLRTTWTGPLSFRQFIKQMEATRLEAYEHQEIPFDKLVGELNPERHGGGMPLVRALFVLQNTPSTELRLSGLEMEQISVDYGYSFEDLCILMQEEPDGLLSALRYSTDLFARSTIERLAGHFERILAEVCAAPDQNVDQISLLTAGERRQILYEWNSTETEYPIEKCLHQLFEEQVAKTPQATAVSYEFTHLTYQELNHEANRLAHYLRAHGVAPDTFVGIYLERSLEMVVSILAVLKAGGAYVPLEPGYPQERLNYMLADSAPAVLLTQSWLQEPLKMSQVPILRLDLDGGILSSYGEENPGLQETGVTFRHLAYMIYTSGSTGKPKGVMNEHGGVVNRLLWARDAYGIGPQDRVLQKTPFSFDVSVWEFLLPLLAGARLIMARPGGHRDPQYLRETIAREEISTIHFVPSMLQAFLDHTDAEDHTSLRRVLCSGEVLPYSLQRQFEKSLPKVELHNLYGPTEAAIDVTAWKCQPGVYDGVVPIGRPIANTEIYILDEQLEPVPQGVTGEIYIGGVGVARGYWNRPELTRERFIDDPFSRRQHARMYKTGDLGRWLSEGTIEYLGRNDFQIKIRGFRIELGEIEARLREHPGVGDAAVVAREDVPGGKRLVAYFTQRKSSAEPVGIEQLRVHLSIRLPEYMVPGAYVEMLALPLSANGKLDRKLLPAPDMGSCAELEYEPPRGKIESAIADIWSDVLKVKRIGRHDNFFQIGGHSLLAVAVIGRMRRSGLNSDVRTLFASPTLAGLAASLGSTVGIEIPPNGIPADCQAITPEMLPLVRLTAQEIGQVVAGVPGGAANVQDVYPLAPLQEGILFHHLVGREGDPYLVRSLLSVDSRSRLEAYLKAMQQVVNRHDILRTAIVWEGTSQPVQVVWHNVVLPVEEVSLETGPNAAEQLYERFGPERYRMDLRQAPLLRVCIGYDAAKARWLMLLLFHHLIGDHTSSRTMLREIQAFVGEETLDLPPPLPFRKLVALAGLEVAQEDHEAFFRKLLGDVDEPTAPFGLLDIQGDGSKITQASVEVDPKLDRGLREQARNLGVGAASLFHLAWAQVLARVSAREDVVFGTVLFGRMQGAEDLDYGMGLFINTLPIRIRIGATKADASVRHVHAMLVDLIRHEHASLSLAQRCSKVRAPNPLFSSLMNYRHVLKGSQGQSSGLEETWTGVEWLRSEERTNYPLTFSVDDTDDSFLLKVQVRSPIDPLRVCGFVHRALEKLYEALETSPAIAIGKLDMLSATEWQQCVAAWNIKTVSGKLESDSPLFPENTGGAKEDSLAPSTSTEEILCEIWAQVLKRKQVGVNENFFHLGGHSILAITLGARVRERFGRALPLAVFFDRPTVAALAAYLDSDDLQRESPLVTLRHDGEDLPLFLVHAGGGGLMGYRELVRALPAHYQIYGFERPGFQSGAVEMFDVEELAGKYLEPLRRCQPHGPYRLAGWSFGGLVAFELARQLESAGERVSFLALIDTRPPYRRMTSHLLSLADRLGLVDNDLLDREIRTLGLTADPVVVERLERILAAHTSAMQRYSPGSGTAADLVVLVRATGDQEKDSTSQYAAMWQVFCRNPLEQHTISGDHYSIMELPRVAYVADVLSRALGGLNALQSNRAHL